MTQTEQVPFTRAVGTVRLASEFLAAARLQDLDRTPPSMVTYYLLGHALELAFKSVLIAHGTSERSLRGIGHDLGAATKAAMKAAPPGIIELDDSDSKRLKRLGHFYQAKAFEYLEPGFMSLPIARELCQLTERLVASIERFVEDHVRSSLRDGRAV
jgi:hypothetical protein